ncbi:Protein CBG05740 [Caenorhabditis briggsae]|nr:Protein CBG05740 [Caenorhabditis briggsae]CAP26573.2 Protein CBG05740 [Caenorhabditis briggsae]
MSFTDNDMCDQVAVIAYDLDSALNPVPSGLQTLLEQNYPLSMLKEEKIEELVTRYIHCPQVGNMARRVIGKINSMEQKGSMKANEKSRKRGWSMESFSSSGSSTNSTEPISKPKNSQPVPSNMTGSSSCLPSIHPTSVQH